MTIKRILTALAIVVLAGPAMAADVTLRWDANDPPATGYRIYAVPYSVPFDYATPVYEGSATSCTVEVQGNIELKFVARAYLIGESGAVYESADSNMVQHAVVQWMNPNLRVE